MTWSKEWPKSTPNPNTDPEGFVESLWSKIEPAIKEYNNKVPTHDPYTNPNAHVYYECSCGKILDPSTKSFAALNNAASEAGWKVRWGESYYQPYCVECGKGIE